MPGRPQSRTSGPNTPNTPVLLSTDPIIRRSSKPALSNVSSSSTVATSFTDYSTSPSSLSVSLDKSFAGSSGFADYKTIDSRFHKFQTKNGIYKANTLRLVLLPFLRLKQAEGDKVSPQDLMKRLAILEKWWTDCLKTLRDRSHPVISTDRAAYLEAISRLLARKEWRDALEFPNNSMSPIYESLLYDTVDYAISKLALRTVPLYISAFAGKVFGYAFFYAPGIANQLLHNLNVPRSNVDRIVKFLSKLNNHPINSMIGSYRSKFPSHLSNLIGFPGFAPPPRKFSTKRNNANININDNINVLYKQSTDILLKNCKTDFYGPWINHWIGSNSDVFLSFVKHYYDLISLYLPQQEDSFVHLMAPGMLIIQAHFLRIVDSLYKAPPIIIPKQKKGNNIHNPNIINNNRINNNNFNNKRGFDFKEANIILPFSLQAQHRKNRNQNHKYLMTIREILHNDEICYASAKLYSQQFERILQISAININVYNIELCSNFIDFVEEYFLSLILPNSLNNSRISKFNNKNDNIDWQFWIEVIQRMFDTENSFLELKSLSFLYNIWDLIPTFIIDQRRNQGLGLGVFLNDHNDENNNSNSWYIDEDQSLRFNISVWILSAPIWKKFFCHWQPLVRAYYLRLICWRIALIDPNSSLSESSSSGLYTSYSLIESNQTDEIRKLLQQQLLFSFEKYKQLSSTSSSSSNFINRCINADPSSPVPHGQFKIIPASKILIPKMASQQRQSITNHTQQPSRKQPQDGLQNSPSITGNESSNVHQHTMLNDPSIVFPNLTVSQNSTVGPRRTNPFDVFDEIAYTYTREGVEVNFKDNSSIFDGASIISSRTAPASRGSRSTTVASSASSLMGHQRKPSRLRGSPRSVISSKSTPILNGGSSSTLETTDDHNSTSSLRSVKSMFSIFRKSFRKFKHSKKGAHFKDTVSTDALVEIKRTKSDHNKSRSLSNIDFQITMHGDDTQVNQTNNDNNNSNNNNDKKEEEDSDFLSFSVPRKPRPISGTSSTYSHQRNCSTIDEHASASFPDSMPSSTSPSITKKTKKINKRNSNSNSSKGNNLSTRLIPPPSEIFNPTPEPYRSPFKFGLMYSDDSGLRSKMIINANNNINNKNNDNNRTDRDNGIKSVDVGNKELNLMPLLPFENPDSSAATVKKPSSNNDASAHALLNDIPKTLDSEDSPIDSSTTTNNLTTTTGDNNNLYTNGSPSTSSISKSPNSLSLSFESNNLNINNHRDVKRLILQDNIRTWNYVGKALSEWKQIVSQFEEYVLNQRQINGIERLEDLAIPTLHAEPLGKISGL